MEFVFILPQKNEDLLETTGNSYCVTKLFDEKECIDRLRGKFAENSLECFIADFIFLFKWPAMH